MKNILTAITCSIVLFFIPYIVQFFELLNEIDLIYFTIYTYSLQVCILSTLAYELIPKKQIPERTIILVYFLYIVTEAQLYMIHKFAGYNIYLWSWFIFFAFCFILFIYNRFKIYNLPSDRICNTNFYICLWKPATLTTTLFSLIGFPVGGVSIYTPMQQWGFKWGKKTYITRQVEPKAVMKKFVTIDTGVSAAKEHGIEIKDKLNSLIGSPSGLFRIRCIITIIPVLKMLGVEWVPKNWLELIPSKWAARCFK